MTETIRIISEYTPLRILQIIFFEEKVGQNHHDNREPKNRSENNNIVKVSRFGIHTKETRNEREGKHEG